MRIAWFSDTFEQNNGVAVYLHETLPLLSKKVPVRLYTGRVLKRYPYPVTSLRSVDDPLLRDYDVILPPTKPIAADVVHAHSQYSLGVYASGFQVPRVITAHFVPYHSLEMFFGSSQPKLLTDAVWKYETWLLNRFDRVICQTRAGANMFKKRGLKSRVEIIANGINLEKYTHANGDRFRKKYGYKKPFALFIGRMDASKNPDWILAAAKRLPDVEFIMSGKGVLEEELKRRSPKNIKWLGKLPREDLLDCYAAAEALLMPSAIETEGLVAQEAMACGTPALISNLDVLAEVVGQGGSVCKSAHDMADQLEHLLDDKPRHALMRQDALKEIRKRDIKRSIAQLVDLYHSLA